MSSLHLTPAPDGIPFIDRAPTDTEVEALRLLLSTFLDGSGGLVALGGEITLPDWRNFERVLALVVRGTTTESKAAYDINIPLPSGRYAGISCKTRGRDALKQIEGRGRLYIEVTNAATQLLKAANGPSGNWREDPHGAGVRLLEKIHSDYYGDHLSSIYDFSKTTTVYLVWHLRNLEYWFEMFWVGRPICRADEVASWDVRNDKALVGFDHEGSMLVEWYEKNGQFKYYPRIDDVVKWRSGSLRLEHVPPSTFRDVLIKKVLDYFNVNIIY